MIVSSHPLEQLRTLLGRLRTLTPRSRKTQRANQCALQLLALEDRVVLDCHLCDTLANLRAANGYDYVAVASGKWTDPIWDTEGDGIPDSTGPQADNIQAKVLINPGVTVTYDTNSASVGVIDVEGTLFLTTPGVSAGEITQLTVGTLFVGHDARLAVGAGDPTAVTNLPLRDQVHVTYDWNNNPFPLGGPDDPNRESLGLMADDHGQVEIRGADKTDFVALRSGYTARSSTLTVSGPVVGWQAGDVVEIAPTTFEMNQPIQAERRTLAAVPTYNATTHVTTLHLRSGLTYDHTPYSGESVHLANLTRNASFASADPSVIDHRAHSMFQTGDVVIANASFVQLGRTDKSNPLNDYTIGRTADTFDPTASNRRGRYALHFHRTLERDLADGLSLDQYHVASVSGCVVDGSPGWGFVNHTSYVNFTGNVAVGCVGAAFVAEAGNELGTFDGNLAMLGTGDPNRGQYQDRRFEDTSSNIPGDKQMAHFGDLGFTGDGFWVGAPGLQVTNNVAAGFSGRGFIVWGQGLFEPDIGTHTINNGRTTKMVDGEMAGYDPSWITWASAATGPRLTYAYGADFHNNGRIVGQLLPYNLFDNNTAYASYLGFQTRFTNDTNVEFVNVDIHTAGRPVYTGRLTTFAHTQFSNLTGWNTYEALNASYTSQAIYRGLTFLTNQGVVDTPAIVSVIGNGFDVTYDTLTVSGYDHLCLLNQTAAPPNHYYFRNVSFTNQPTPGAWVYSYHDQLFYDLPTTLVRW